MDILKSILTNLNLWAAIVTPLALLLIERVPELAGNELLTGGTIAVIIVALIKQAFDNHSEAQTKAAEIHANAMVAAAAVGPTVTTPTEVRQEYPFQGGERG